MIRILFSVITCLSTFAVFGQGYEAYVKLQVRQIEINQITESFGLTDEQFQKLQGSPYANEEFAPGSVFKENELATKNVQLRYNIYSDEMEVQNRATPNSIGALKKEEDLFVKIGFQLYTYVPFEGSVEKGHYFNIVSSQKEFSLYKKTEARFVPPKAAKTSYQTQKPARFTEKNTYYLVSQDERFYELPPKKSKIIDVMSVREKEIKAYIKRSRLDLSDEKDLVKLVTYYNSIL